MISRATLLLGSALVAMAGLAGAVTGALVDLVPTEDVVSARTAPPRVGRVIEPDSVLNGVNQLSRLGYGKPPPAQPPPPRPPVFRPPPPPPPPPPPDVSVVFRESVVAVDSSGQGVRVVVRGGLDAGARVLRVGDVFMDGWVIAALSPAEGRLVRGTESRTVRLFVPPQSRTGVL